MPIVVSAQTKADSLWLPLKPLIGTWIGAGDGPDGKGTYERTYALALNKKFIEVRNKAVYEKGYVHEDHGFISYDKGRKAFVYRQFHTEGFVNQYKLESISPDGKTIVFVTESIENIPPGWRARETYTFSGLDDFTEDFNLAEPNKDFAAYTKTSFKRKK